MAVALVGVTISLPCDVVARTSRISKIVTYITTYAGSYSFIEYDKAVDYAGRVTVNTQNQSYVWQEEVKDVLVPRKNGTISEQRYTTVDAHGDYDGAFPDETPSTVHCDYSSQPRREFKSKVLGDPEGIAPVHGNPLIPFSWVLPEFAGELGVRSSCDTEGEILAETPRQSGTIGVALEHTPEFEHVFEATEAARFKSMPVRLPLSVTLANRAELPHGGYDQAQVRIVGGVEFARWGDPRNSNKVGNLLLDDLLRALGADASPDGSPIADGDDDQILVPGVAPGTVTTEVTGTVSWKHGRRIPAAAAGPAQLYVGRANVTGDNPVTMRLTPTALGRSALRVSHPSTPIELRVTFTPSGGGPKVTRTAAATLGAS